LKNNIGERMKMFRKSDDFVLANVLNDISNFETGQISVQNNSQTVAVTISLEK
jgi:hypothetical protein